MSARVRRFRITGNIKATGFALLLAFGVLTVQAQNWVPAPGVPNEEIQSLTLHAGSLYAAGESGIYQSTDDGKSWNRLSLKPNPPNYLTSLFVARGQLYAGIYGEGVFVSGDGGQSWRNMSAGLSGWGTYAMGFALLGDSLYLATGGYGVFVLNLLQTDVWHEWNEGLPQYGMITIAAAENHIVVSTGINVFVRQRGGSTWDYLSVDGTTSQRPVYKFHLTTDHLFAGSSVGVFRSSRDGQTWRKMEIPFLANLPVETFAADGNRLYVGVRYKEEHFICSTDNAGSSWDFRTHELVLLRDMLVSHGRLWAARLDGLWSMDLGAWTSVEDQADALPRDIKLHQNYPNPFNPSTKIGFTIPSRAHVFLEVHDVLGRKIGTLVNEFLPPGYHSRSFDGSNLPSGTYFYTLRTGRSSTTKKLIIQR